MGEEWKDMVPLWERRAQQTTPMFIQPMELNELRVPGGAKKKHGARAGSKGGMLMGPAGISSGAGLHNG